MISSSVIHIPLTSVAPKESISSSPKSASGRAKTFTTLKPIVYLPSRSQTDPALDFSPFLLALHSSTTISQPILLPKRFIFPPDSPPLNHHGKPQPSSDAKGGQPQGEIPFCNLMNEGHDQ